jgi:hypothetical protein
MASKLVASVDMKEAVARAKAFIPELFADEKIEDVQLDEVDFGHAAGHWLSR